MTIVHRSMMVFNIALLGSAVLCCYIIYFTLLCSTTGTHKLRKTAVIRPDPTQFLQRKYGNLLFSVQNTSAQMLDPAKKGRKSSINTVCYVHENEKHVKNGRIDELF